MFLIRQVLTKVVPAWISDPSGMVTSATNWKLSHPACVVGRTLVFVAAGAAAVKSGVDPAEVGDINGVFVGRSVGEACSVSVESGAAPAVWVCPAATVSQIW